MTNIIAATRYPNGKPQVLGPPAPCSLSIGEFCRIFPDDLSAERWFEKLRWPAGILCPRCGGDRYSESESTNGAHVLSYWCYYCRKRFNVRSGTDIQGIKLPLKKWTEALYLSVNGPISATGLSGYLGTETSTASSVLRSIREAWRDSEPLDAFEAEIDEAYFPPRGSEGKIIVLGIKDRYTGRIAAIVISRADLPTIESYLQLHMHDDQGILYSDGYAVYKAVKCVADHQPVIHTEGEYVNGPAHTNGLESFWSTLKHAYRTIYRHNISRENFHLFLNEMVGRHNVRDKNTMEKMKLLASRLVKGSV